MSLRSVAKFIKPTKQFPITIHLCPTQPRQMTTSRRVQDRSHSKRIHDLEIVTERWKIFSKIHFLMEQLKAEPEHITPIRNLEQYRRQINLPKPHKLSDFLRKSPKLFELYKDQKGTLWVGMTQEAEDLLEEEEREIEKHSDKAAEYVSRLLMMSIDKRLQVDKIAHFRRDMGLPMDFRTKWVYKYPELFRVVKSEDGNEYLELVEWKNEWAVTELEKKAGKIDGGEVGLSSPGKLSLAFSMKFPPNYKKVYRYGGKIEHFQRREYLSPYADARELEGGSQEFYKRAIAIMHEVLSFTLEKRLVTDHLTHFRWEFKMPQKLMRLFLKHFGIFYVSERGKRFHVFLNEAYERSDLIEKCPLILWREKVHRLIGYRGKKKKIATFEELSDIESKDLFRSDSEDERLRMDPEEEGVIEGFDDEEERKDGNDNDEMTDDGEMYVEEVASAYKDV